MDFTLMFFMRFLVPALVLVGLSTFEAPAQSEPDLPENCVLTELDSPTRFALRCAGILVIEMDAAAELGWVDGPNGLPSRMTLRDGTLLIEVVPDTPVPPVRTPNAVAAVRGTTYALQVIGDTTEVFVLEGQVDVRRRSLFSPTVQLGPGQGIDIGPGNDLQVMTWPAARVNALLSRFGR